MSIRGSVTLECDSKGCHAEEVIKAEDANVDEDRYGFTVACKGAGWHMDDDGYLRCPQCCEENPREKGDDDGQEYGHPGDRLAGRE